MIVLCTNRVLEWSEEEKRRVNDYSTNLVSPPLPRAAHRQRINTNNDKRKAQEIKGR